MTLKGLSHLITQIATTPTRVGSAYIHAFPQDRRGLYGIGGYDTYRYPQMKGVKMAGLFTFGRNTDPFVQHAYNIWAQHYGGQLNPQAQTFFNRIAPELQKSVEGKALMGAIGTGSLAAANNFLGMHLPQR